MSSQQPSPALAEHTTLRVGGRPHRYVPASTTDELVDAIREVDDAQEPLFILGGGSNVVIADEPFPGTVVHVLTQGVTVESSDDCSGASVRVAAGHPWDSLVQRAEYEGWVGIEALSGIPGSTGATPVQNVGAYGQEVAKTIAQVRVWDRLEQQVRTFSAADCDFGYRTSVFKETSFDGLSGRFIVLDVLFQLRLGELSEPIGYADLAKGLGVAVGERVPLAQAREAVLAQRNLRGMVLNPQDHDTWSTGSFFTNPVLSSTQLLEFDQRVVNLLGPQADPPKYSAGQGTKLSAAWLIEQAGFGKGYGLPGPVSLSTKHTLAVTNRGGASSRQVLALAREVQIGVHETFGITLHNEPILVGGLL